MKFELQEITTNGELTVQNYEETLSNLIEILKAINVPEKITTELEKKELKNSRATLNRMIKQINERRIGIVEDFTSSFQRQCKNFVNLINEKQILIGEKVKEYEDSKKEIVVEKQKTITATLKFNNPNVLEKLIKFCEENLIELKVSGGN
jgi:vacuolar-type H+-ATPase subunit H